MAGSANKYDLEERATLCAIRIIKFLKTIKKNTENRPLVAQLVRAITSVGVNYAEANGALTKKDFAHKIALCKKESKESLFWLRVLAETEEVYKDEIREHYKEARELVLIFSKIHSSCKK